LRPQLISPFSLCSPHMAVASQSDVQLPEPQNVGPYPHLPILPQQLQGRGPSVSNAETRVAVPEFASLACRQRKGYPGHSAKPVACRKTNLTWTNPWSPRAWTCRAPQRGSNGRRLEPEDKVMKEGESMPPTGPSNKGVVAWLEAYN
jgi:hypothetical protein